MDSKSRGARAVLISIVSIPCLFLAILFGWGALDNLLSAREVSRFIRDHQALVAKRLADPKVHSFSLVPDPDHPATLLIRFDVEDRATYEMLEADLDEIWTMRSPPRWDTNLRSKEALGNNLGFAAAGIGEVAEFAWCVGFAAIVSISLPVVSLFFVLRRARSRPTKPGKADQAAPLETEEIA